MHDGWFSLQDPVSPDREIVNVARTVRLDRALGIYVTRLLPSKTDWIATALGDSPSDYDDVSTAPWYDADVPASAEFAGVIPLNVGGLEDSALISSVTEYVTDGGSLGRLRAGTQAVVFDVDLIASTPRGLEYGLRWLSRTLTQPTRQTCVGSSLYYFAARPGSGETPEKVHRNDVKITRGISVTRRRVSSRSVVARATFTLTAADSHEYGEPIEALTGLGSSSPGGALLNDDGDLIMAETSCPDYDYSPVYDPLYPAFVTPPPLPNMIPAGWRIEDGLGFKRYWALLNPVHPVDSVLVPVFSISTTTEARLVRLSIRPSYTNSEAEICDPLWGGVVSYVPVGDDIIVSGEHRHAYVDYGGGATRLADSLVFSPNARPLRWTAVDGLGNEPGSGFVVTADFFELSGGGYEGGGDVSVDLHLVPVYR